MNVQPSNREWNGYRVSANVSLLFGELPYDERFAAAARAGFAAVETWWPFAGARPSSGEIEEFCGRVADAGVELTGLNFYAGDMAAGERGVACRPERARELEDATAVVLQVARATGCRGFNLLYGQLDPAQSPDRQRQVAVQAYRRAARTLAEVGGTVLVEPLARGLNGHYPLHTHSDALGLIAEIDEPGVAILVDTFHLAMNEVEVPTAIDECAGRIGHVQLADAPGRGEPGSGALDWGRIGAALQQSGYTGTVAAEYRPNRPTAETLAWISG